MLMPIIDLHFCVPLFHKMNWDAIRVMSFSSLLEIQESFTWRMKMVTPEGMLPYAVANWSPIHFLYHLVHNSVQVGLLELVRSVVVLWKRFV